MLRNGLNSIIVAPYLALFCHGGAIVAFRPSVNFSRGKSAKADRRERRVGARKIYNTTRDVEVYARAGLVLVMLLALVTDRVGREGGEKSAHKYSVGRKKSCRHIRTINEYARRCFETDGSGRDY